MLDPQFRPILLVQLFSCNDWLRNAGNSFKPFSIEWVCRGVDKPDPELDRKFKYRFV